MKQKKHSADFAINRSLPLARLQRFAQQLLGPLLFALLTIPSFAVGTVAKVVCSQAGYSSGSYKVAHVLATDALATPTYQVLNGATVIASGTMKDEGVVWGSRVYSVDFSSVTATGTNFTVKSNSVSSPVFPIQTNIWDSYKDEMTSFYRMQRFHSTTLANPSGYSSTAPSAKAYHDDSFLDDGLSEDGLSHADLSGGWADAGDYGKYTGNQWVQGVIALTYLRHATSAGVNFDNDSNGIPDIIDEAKYGCDYLIKFANQFNGAVYDLPNPGGWKHPELYTDNIVNSPVSAVDDRKYIRIGIGGSAKGAGALAATARAVNWALANNKIAPAQVTAMQAFSADCQSAAITLYNFAINNPTLPSGSYTSATEMPNFLLWAETELYLLTGTASYKTTAESRIPAIPSLDRPTNYWDLKPITLVEFYPVASATIKTQIQGLLKRQLEYFEGLVDDTPYGVLSTFSTFGVNEPHLSYVSDAIRYYELFNDPAALRTALKGLYWVFGDNPWSKSWVSGIGTDYTKFIHTRLDAEAYDHAATGIILPGAMVSGPNIEDTKNRNSVSPWYEDRPIWQDDITQWRYQEYSVSIVVGLFYSVNAMIDLNANSTSGGTVPDPIAITSPKIGDFVVDDVDIFARPSKKFTTVEFRPAGVTTYTAMSGSNGIYLGSTNVSADNPYTQKTYTIRGTDASGNYSYSISQFRVAPKLPTPSTPLLYDDFNYNGVWGAQRLGWVNWYNDKGGAGSYALGVVDSRNVGIFHQGGAGATSQAKFEPWHDNVDLRGYRYLTFVMKNPGYPNARIKINIIDPSGAKALSGGAVNVPTTWTTYNFDMDAFPTLDKSSIHIEMWLSQVGGGSGDILIDDISATNVASGTAPTITATSLNVASGDEETTFVWNAKYTDIDNQKPFKMQAVIDGVIHEMTEVSAADTTYTDGKDYTYSSTLPYGAHVYYFRTTDTTSSVVSTTEASGPLVDGYEFENLTSSARSAGDNRTSIVDLASSGGRYDRLDANAATDFIEYKVDILVPGTYTVKPWYRKGIDRGIYQLSIDSVNQGAAYDCYAAAAANTQVNLGNVTFATAGTKLFRFTCTGKNASSAGYKFYGDNLILELQ